MKNEYPVAKLNEQELTKLQQTEKTIREDIGKDIILIAYEDSEGGQVNG
ncbi:hypothetical protein LC040_02595 [Bacillus tianshenii]|nr:hypothetical protein LC040_02595 [Bacillus tianshenii]